MRRHPRLKSHVPFIPHLTQNYPEAKPSLDAWRAGKLTWEEAMMKVAKSLFIAKEETQRRLNYALSPSQSKR